MFIVEFMLFVYDMIVVHVNNVVVFRKSKSNENDSFLNISSFVKFVHIVVFFLIFTFLINEFSIFISSSFIKDLIFSLSLF
jgi:hypothetical protein